MAGARDYQRHFASKFELITNGTAEETDSAGQIGIVENLMRLKVDAIVLVPTDSRALVSVAAQAVKARILVVTIDNALDAELLRRANVSVPFVGPDNRKGARLVAGYLATKLKPGDEVGIIGGLAADINAQQRTAGFKEAMRAAGANIVDVQAGGWGFNSGSKIGSSMLAAHQRIRALICANDNIAMGAIEALRIARRTGSVYVTGYNNIEAIKPLIEDGRVLATVDQFVAKQAVYGVDVVLNALTGMKKQQELSSFFETPVQIVTRTSTN
jgi:ribose transport system substrate-binding protein